MLSSANYLSGLFISASKHAQEDKWAAPKHFDLTGMRAKMQHSRRPKRMPHFSLTVEKEAQLMSRVLWWLPTSCFCCLINSELENSRHLPQTSSTQFEVPPFQAVPYLFVSRNGARITQLKTVHLTRMLWRNASKTTILGSNNWRLIVARQSKVIVRSGKHNLQRVQKIVGIELAKRTPGR
jgi:hypothetical protein